MYSWKGDSVGEESTYQIELILIECRKTMKIYSEGIHYASPYAIALLHFVHFMGR